MGGGYATAPWEAKPGRFFYGTDESFVFSFGAPGDAGADPVGLRTYGCLPGGKTMFMFAGTDMMAMGGSGDGDHAIVLQQDLLHGTSKAAETFSNPGLASGHDFVVNQLEVWTFEGDFND